MSEKKTMHLVTAKGVAWVKGQPSFAGKWGVGEHLALHRRITLDVLPDATKLVGQPRKGKDGKPLVNLVNGEQKPVLYTLEVALNEKLREVHAADPELGYASNFDKLLKKCGEIAESSEYE